MIVFPLQLQHFQKKNYRVAKVGVSMISSNAANKTIATQPSPIRPQ
jgi:hypothetical protein